MSGARTRPRWDQPSVSDLMVLFLAFVTGACAACFGARLIPAISSPRIYWSVLLSAVMIFSVSMVGSVLLPVCTVFCGVFAEQGAMSWMEAVDSGSFGPFDLLMSSLVLVSLFFMISAHGMTVSFAMQTAAQRGSPTARETYRKEFQLVILLWIAALAAVFYFY